VGDKTNISWTDHTFNPWTGCHKISPGCDHCYAAELDHRWGGEHWGTKAPRKFYGAKHWAQPLAWNRKAEKDGVRRRVFCASMADVFEDRKDLEPQRIALWDLILSTSHLDWLLLTKRPENFAKLLPWIAPQPLGPLCRDCADHDGTCPRDGRPCNPREPYPNVWLGVTAENQHYADERISILLTTDASKRFVSYEPALEYVTFWAFLRSPVRDECLSKLGASSSTPGLDWIIAGDESGARRRPAELDWFRSVRDQCAGTGTAFHLKQLHEGKKKIHLPVLDGRQHAEFPT